MKKLFLFFTAVLQFVNVNATTTQADTLFYDNFNDNSISTAKWTTTGSSYSEANGILNLYNAVTDDNPEAISVAFVVNNKYPIKIYRRVYLTYANNQVDHLLILTFGSSSSFTDYAGYSKGVAVSYANYDYYSLHGLYIGDKWNNPGTNVIGTVSSSATVPWNTWFDEIITYNPSTGVATENVNGTDVASITIDTLSSAKKYARIYFLSYGWWTGHTHQVDYVLITQQKNFTNTKINDAIKKEVSIYPNPVNNEFFVNGIEGKAQLDVLDLTGKIIFSKQITTTESIPASSLTQGVYLVKISTASGSVEKKLIKK